MNETSLYCKAFYLRDLRRFRDWRESRENWKSADAPSELADEQIVLVHDDFSVTYGVFHGEDVLFRGEGDAWRAFCTDALKFEIPEDLRYRYEAQAGDVASNP